MIQGRIWLRLATLELGLALALGTVAAGSPPASKVQVLAYNRRNFLIPFKIPAEEIPRTKQIQLCVSSDGGGTWQAVAVTTPERQYFNFKAKSDGVYWFAARRVDPQGRLFPADDADVEPNMKVTIDTTKPVLTIQPRPRRGNVASIGWEVTDEALDLSTLAFEYQVDGSADWAPIPLQKQARIGFESWNADTAEPVKVRGIIVDMAGNRTVETITLPGGGIPDDFQADVPDTTKATTPPPIGTFASKEATRPASSTSKSRRSNAEDVGDYDPYAAGAADPAAAAPAAAAAEPANPPILVSNPKFGLQYAVDDAGPNGPAVVELFVTGDGGRTWTSRGEDTDRTSPFLVDLGGEGRYGLKLVAKSAADQGDRPPVAGEAPQTIVDVDTSGPAVTIEGAKVAGNKLVITWRATDPHSTSRPVMISIRGTSPDAKWAPITPMPIENTGQYQWLISSKCPPKIYVRVDVRDALNNLGFAETTDSDPVVVDRTKPKGRILGLDASAARTSP